MQNINRTVHSQIRLHSVIKTIIFFLLFSAPAIPYLCVFIGVWGTLFLEFWKRKQKMTAMQWGMVGFEEEEQDRCGAVLCTN